MSTRVRLQEDQDPITNGKDYGKHPGNGRFMPGNPGGPGNLLGRKMVRVKRMWLECVTPHDVRRVYKMLLEEALTGRSVKAAQEWLNRTLGRVPFGVVQYDGGDVPSGGDGADPRYL
jgi:hypothetical protein